ncbi:hypothetical protein [Kribbella albertanoniae]|uniref:Uncharacterized protein n=1 Tax=Kribbella albertanoniae TaxID=1266829 RepID=A0A4R4Q5E6_9ACTN|nr:hypothetical protein [Kribbella albertanoniae]TDC30189.1 hypothetical protein E1261_13940 [Kribbella albertanoniae]
MTEQLKGRRSVLSYWPVVLGAAAATFQLVAGVAADAVAITVSVAASCYLAAAALGQRWIAWAGVLTGSVVVTVSEVTGLAWWLGLSVYAVVLLLVGLLRRASSRPLTAQGIAMLAFAGLAVVGVLVSPRLGLAIAGVALASHAGWDYLHWRRNEVVPRSLAEFCIVLDLPLGTAAVVLAFTT